MKEQPENIENIKVTEKIKYLGLEIDNKRNYFKSQKKNIMEKAQRLANVTYSVIAKSCNKIIIGKTYWKTLVLPSVLYGTNIINLTETEINKLQRIENGVYRQILGAPKYTACCTLRGEIGASSMKTRMINGRVQFIKNIQEGKNELLKEILRDMKEDGNYSWMKVTNKYLGEIELRYGDIGRLTKEKLKEMVKNWDSRKWKEEVNNKTSLKIYEREKVEIREENVYDNRPSSIILFRARTNTLPLNDRNRHGNGSMECKLCGSEREDLKHFLMDCRELENCRRKVLQLQRPYLENSEETIGRFLFDEVNVEDKKEILYEMWRKREWKIKELNA